MNATMSWCTLLFGYKNYRMNRSFGIMLYKLGVFVDAPMADINETFTLGNVKSKLLSHESTANSDVFLCDFVYYKKMFSP